MSSSITVLEIGLDIGGTNTRSSFARSDVLSDVGAVDVRENVSRGANLQAEGPARVAQLIARLVDDIRTHFNPDTEARIVAGVAGAGREEDRRLVERHFHDLRSGTDRLRVYSDADIALEGAFTGGSGVIIIAGTGSGAYALDADGVVRRAGGWGPRLGDPGSGTSIGLSALRSVAKAFDGGLPTGLSSLYANAFQIHDGSDLIRSVYTESVHPALFAPLALEAAEQGDEVAMGVVSREIAELADESSLIFQETVSPRFVLMGGMCENAFYRELLTSALQKRNPGWDLTVPDASPQRGALRLAKRIEIDG